MYFLVKRHDKLIKDFISRGTIKCGTESFCFHESTDHFHVVIIGNPEHDSFVTWEITFYVSFLLVRVLQERRDTLDQEALKAEG